MFLLDAQSVVNLLQYEMKNLQKVHSYWMRDSFSFLFFFTKAIILAQKVSMLNSRKKRFTSSQDILVFGDNDHQLLFSGGFVFKLSMHSNYTQSNKIHIFSIWDHIYMRHTSPSVQSMCLPCPVCETAWQKTKKNWGWVTQQKPAVINWEVERL